MKYFKNSINQVFALDEKDSPEKWLKTDCIEINESEAMQLAKLWNEKQLAELNGSK
jgi:hypothetical protein